MASLIFFTIACKKNEVVNINNANINASSIKANIIVETPKDNDEIGQPVIISGQARVFENQLNYQIQDGNGSVLAEGGLYAQSPDMGQYGPFEVETTYIEPKTDTGSITIFNSAARTKIDMVTIPVKFKKPLTDKILVYFGSNTLNPGAMDCTKVFSVERTILKTPGTAKAALEELLKGPTEAEKAQGYFSSINSGVKLQSVSISDVDGVAKADFDETLEFQVGGSCRVAAIASQIIETLKQFSTVGDVVISINGRTEDILQP